MNKPRVVIVGCGNRGLDAYGSWIADHPEEAEVVGLVESKPNRIALGRRIFPQVKSSAVFEDWQDFLAHPTMADGVILATQDQQHREAAVACARKGYHLLLEKPMAPTEEECREIVAEVLRSGIIFAVAHVLRYASLQVLSRYRPSSLLHGEALSAGAELRQPAALPKRNETRGSGYSFVLP
jgi:predicted dehydrogenase